MELHDHATEVNTLLFNGALFENSFRKRNQLGNPVSKQTSGAHEQKLVEIICYCVNPNHYHFILKQVVDRGIEKFMHRLGLGYAKYFNLKYKRNGTLFEGPFKAVHIDSNEYLMYLSAYVNLNYRVHRLGNHVSKSSWGEYAGKQKGLCDAHVILDQVKNRAEYKQFAEEAVKIAQERKDMERFLLE